MFCGMSGVEFRGLFLEFSEISNNVCHPFNVEKGVAAPG
jgi:hypothetical protein